MKENFNIEELFKQKFDNFQPDVDPGVWANIQAGIGTGTAGVVGGVSAAVKIGLISGGIIAASVATWYFGFYEPAQSTQPVAAVSELLRDENEINLPPPVHVQAPIIVVNDQNDPLILENKAQIEKELRNHQGTHQNQGGNTAVNNNGSTSSNTTNVVGNGDTNPVLTEQPINSNTDNGTTPDDKKDLVPTGNMELSQAGVYAPSNVSFISNARNYTAVRWDFGDGYTGEGTEVKHTYTKPGKYQVKMTVAGEKTTYEESQEIVVKSKSSIDNVPNVITPNGDRINDVFVIKSTDIETFYITITDNHGNEIFTSNDKDFSWDGTDYSGQTVEKGIYTYIIIAEGKDGSVIKLPGQIYVQ